MKLAQLLSIYPELFLGDQPAEEVSGIFTDSRQLTPGGVFVAIRGTQLDGHVHLGAAVEAGAIGLVVENRSLVPRGYRGAVVAVKDTRIALYRLASHYYQNPAAEMFCVGVTGTNGKTSITYMIEAIFREFGWPTGVMGTIDHHLGEHRWTSQLTTPDPLTLQKRLREFVALGARAAAFEVSSHALDQRRAEGIPFDVAVFTNLTRDHLDYHAGMEEYFAAKERLFTDLLAQSSKPRTFAVINGDDSFGRRLRVADRSVVWYYGRRDADLKFRILQSGFQGCRFELETPRGSGVAEIQLTGLHNVYNATAALGVGLAAGASFETCLEGLRRFTGVPGRLQRVPISQGIFVFVDYAHTDDALRSVLEALQEIRQNSQREHKILTVFGCGGDRDKGKRPLMAQVAAEKSDAVFITSDNPRTEDPEQIIRDCVTGVPKDWLNSRVFTEVDRKRAIERALRTAQDGDVVLIAGKGHEDYQIIGTEKRPFSDFQVVQEIMA